MLPAPTAIPRPLPAAEQPGSKDRLAGKRFGVYWDHFQDAEPEVVRICRQAVDSIKDNGGQVTLLHSSKHTGCHMAPGVSICLRL